MKIRIKKQHKEDAPARVAPIPAGESQPVSAGMEETVFDRFGEVSAFGIKVLLDGTQWVINGLTGDPMPRDKAKPAAKDEAGHLIWLKEGDKLIPGVTKAFPSIWTNKKKE